MSVYQQCALMAGMIQQTDSDQRFTFGRTDVDIPAGSLVAVNLIGERHLIRLHEPCSPEIALQGLQGISQPRRVTLPFVPPIGDDPNASPCENHQAKQLARMADEYRETGRLPGQ